MDSLLIEAYDRDTLTSLVLNVRNVGANVLNLGTADRYVGGVEMSVSTTNSTGGTCTTPRAVYYGTLCVGTMTISGLTVTSVTVDVAKIA